MKEGLCKDLNNYLLILGQHGEEPLMDHDDIVERIAHTGQFFTASKRRLGSIADVPNNFGIVKPCGEGARADVGEWVIQIQNIERDE